jgi:hypothetical protein
MNGTTIHLALVDDWELSGSGAGDPRDLQFRPIRHLTKIYNKYGIRGSFNAEVMQQLAFRDFQTQHPHLKSLADEWDATIQETFRQGHDIQLHTHPQWSSSEYQDGKWILKGDWSIVNYSSNEARQMLVRGKEYLESLLRPLNSNYRCISYRAGSWCVAPSSFMLNLLADLGIVFDISIVGKLKYDTRRIKLDYSNCEEDFAPFYPAMTDARRVSNKAERIVCIPTNHFYGSRRLTLKHHLTKVAAKLSRGQTTTTGQTSGGFGSDWADTKHDSSFRRIYEKGVVPYLKGKHLISDLAQLNYPLMREMLSSIRRRARATGLSNLPVVLSIHTKDIRAFDDIERFVSDIATAPDIKCVTLTDIARELQNGTFAIKTR